MGAHLIDPRATIPQLQVQIDELERQLVDQGTQLARLARQLEALEAWRREYDTRWYRRLWTWCGRVFRA